MRVMLCVGVAVLCGTGCDMLKKKPAAAAPTKVEETTVTPGPGGGVVVSGGVGGGGGGAAQATRGAVKRTVAAADLQQIAVFINNAAIDRMPTAAETYQALQQGAPNIAKLIDERVITLNGVLNREGVWAYETAAYTQGGMVLTNQGVERMDAQTLKQRLGQ